MDILLTGEKLQSLGNLKKKCVILRLSVNLEHTVHLYVLTVMPTYVSCKGIKLLFSNHRGLTVCRSKHSSYFARCSHVVISNYYAWWNLCITDLFGTTQSDLVKGGVLVH